MILIIIVNVLVQLSQHIPWRATGIMGCALSLVLMSILWEKDDAQSEEDNTIDEDDGDQVTYDEVQPVWNSNDIELQSNSAYGKLS